MSQSWTIPPPGTQAQSVALETTLPNALNALRTLFSGASEPTTTIAYMLWADTTNGLLKQRNAGDSDWEILGPLALSLARKTISLRLPDSKLAAGVDLLLFQADRACFVNRVGVLTDTATSSDGSNHWLVQIANLTAGNDLRVAAYNTNTDGDFAADAANWIALDQNQLIAANDVLRFEFSQIGAGAGTLVEAILQLEIEER